MNTQNYASLEASKRLHDAGIELETDFGISIDDLPPVRMLFFRKENFFKV